MQALLPYTNGTVRVDFSQPLGISTPLHRQNSNPNAYFLPQPQFEPFRAGSFVGCVAEGGACNCEVLSLSPHGNGTHTECVGHISAESYYIKDCLQNFLFWAKLISLRPRLQANGDYCLRAQDIEAALGDFQEKALVIRTLDNPPDKALRQWSGTNPPYLEQEAALLLRERGILHLLVDVPSVDREEDGGKLSAHHAFWNYPTAPRTNATITEMVYVPESITDGEYLLQFAILALESDASPSNVVLYKPQLMEH